jgi:CBS domain-containing protein
MKVKELMRPHAKAIWITESLTDAAREMWENNCGILPIIKDGQKVVGLITDRDICMATAMKDRTPSSISVEEVMSGLVYGVSPDDEVEHALAIMSKHRIRRLPVLNETGELVGMLSMDDIARGASQDSGIGFADVVKTYQAICRHPNASENPELTS